MEFIFLHKCIKDTSTNETILTEHWLNICRRSWTPERTGEIPSELGRMKKRREKKKRERMRRGYKMGPAPLRVLKERKISHIWGNPLKWWGHQMGQKGSIWSCQRRVKQHVCGTRNRVGPIQMVHATTLHTPAWDICLSLCMKCCMLECGDWKANLSEDCFWLQGIVWREGSESIFDGEYLWRKQTATKAWHHCWMMCRGSTCFCSLSPTPHQSWLFYAYNKMLGKSSARASLHVPATGC